MKPEVLDTVGVRQLDGDYGKRPRPLTASREYYRCALSSVNGKSPIHSPSDIRVELVLELDGRKVCVWLRGKSRGVARKQRQLYSSHLGRVIDKHREQERPKDAALRDTSGNMPLRRRERGLFSLCLLYTSHTAAM